MKKVRNQNELSTAVENVFKNLLDIKGELIKSVNITDICHEFNVSESYIRAIGGFKKGVKRLKKVKL